MRVERQEKNIAHIPIFATGLAYSALLSMNAGKFDQIGAWYRTIFSPPGFGFFSSVLGCLLLLTKKHKLEKMHLVTGALYALSSLSLILSGLIESKSLFVSGATTLLQHYVLLYYICALILSLDFLPVFSVIAREISPNTHMDLKIGYFALNIAVYSTHSFSMYFFHKHLKLSVYDSGYIGCLSVFYLFNMIAAPVIDRYKITKIAAIFMMCSSTAIYSVFLLVKSSNASSAIIGGIYGLYLIFLSPVYSLYDVLVLSTVSEKHAKKTAEERKEVFSRIRMWASIGHSLAGFVISYVSHLFNDRTKEWKKVIEESGFTMLICVLIVSSAVFVCITYLSVEEIKEPKEEISGSNENEKNRPAANSSPLLNPNFFFFLFVITSIGVTRGISSGYLVNYMSLYFNLEFNKLSSIMCIRTLSEMVILYYSKHLLKYFGYYWLLFFSLAAATIREFNYAYMPQSHVIIWSVCNEMFKGISSACIVFSAINIADALSGKKNKALAQACYSGCYNGLSILLSSLLGLASLHAFKDFRALFLSSSLCGLICCIIVVVKYGMVDGHLGKLRKKVI